MTDRDKARFWEKVHKAGGTQCWQWKFPRAISKNPRPMFSIGGRSGRVTQAARIMWELTNGEIADGLCVLHRCDNPTCVNPKHLFLGTHQDNVRDMIKKGRQRFRRTGFKSVIKHEQKAKRCS